MEENLNKLKLKCVNSDMSKAAKEMFCYICTNYGLEEFPRSCVESPLKWRNKMTLQELVREYYLVCIHGQLQVNPRLIKEVSLGL